MSGVDRFDEEVDFGAGGTAETTMIVVILSFFIFGLLIICALSLDTICSFIFPK